MRQFSRSGPAEVSTRYRLSVRDHAPVCHREGGGTPPPAILAPPSTDALTIGAKGERGVPLGR